MKYLLTVILIILAPAITTAQSVTVSPVSAHSGNSPLTYPLQNGSVSSSGNNLRVQGAAETSDFGNLADWALSPGNVKVGLLSRGHELSLNQLDNSGTTLIEEELEFFDPSDETLALYVFDDGRSVVRDNVANFSFYDASGNIMYSISNSSQSSGGERESGLAADPAGRTVVLYNPVISYGSGTGSQARLVFGNEDSKVFFRDQGREIREIHVNNKGSVVALLASSGSSDRIIIFDRFGTEIRTINVDSGQRGLTLSENGSYVTIYSGSRVQVYNTVTGERVGSTSSRSSVILASYQPEDETIIILGGSESNMRITEPTITAVHVSRRQIARENIGVSLSISGMDNLRMDRTGAHEYRISGLNQHLDIRTAF